VGVVLLLLAGGRRRLGERGRLCGAEEEGTGCSDADGEVVVEEAERRCRSVDVAVPAVEGAVGEQAAPGLADEGGTLPGTLTMVGPATWYTDRLSYYIYCKLALLDRSLRPH
jgi:hypothetical protein